MSIIFPLSTTKLTLHYQCALEGSEFFHKEKHLGLFSGSEGREFGGVLLTKLGNWKEIKKET